MEDECAAVSSWSCSSRWSRPGSPRAAKPASWAAAEIRALGQDPAAFRPDDTVTRGELAELVASATATAPAPIAKPAVPLSIQDLDARLVAALGLTPDAKAFTEGAKAAGLAPPSRFGTEAVARLLGLRKNHAAKDDALERLPAEPASRAEAAYSLAQIVRFRGYELERLHARLGHVPAPGADRLAAPDPRDRLQARRLPLRLGRHERRPPDLRREVGSRRLRLLRVRLARLQAAGLRVLGRRSRRRSRAGRPTR